MIKRFPVVYWAYEAAALSVRSAGLLLYRQADRKLEVLLVHPGGPFWRKRDDGVWSIPKGELAENETGMDVARREFQEELGMPAPRGQFTALGEVRQTGGKVVQAWAVPGDLDVTRSTSNTFELEWPPGSRKMQQFPEVDRAAWFDLDAARRKLLPAQRAFIDRLEELL
jgi:predicted NUDIX family NTP pyrophosphohydrolase